MEAVQINRHGGRSIQVCIIWNTRNIQRRPNTKRANTKRSNKKREKRNQEHTRRDSIQKRAKQSITARESALEPGISGVGYTVKHTRSRPPQSHRCSAPARHVSIDRRVRYHGRLFLPRLSPPELSDGRETQGLMQNRKKERKKYKKHEIGSYRNPPYLPWVAGKMAFGMDGKKCV